MVTNGRLFESVVFFYFINGLDLDYQEELEAMLILISIREGFVDPDVAVDYLESITTDADLSTFKDYLSDEMFSWAYQEESEENDQ